MYTASQLEDETVAGILYRMADKIAAYAGTVRAAGDQMTAQFHDPARAKAACETAATVQSEIAAMLLNLGMPSLIRAAGRADAKRLENER